VIDPRSQRVQTAQAASPPRVSTEPGSCKRYTCVGGDPIKLTDPTGRSGVGSELPELFHIVEGVTRKVYEPNADVARFLLRRSPAALYGAYAVHTANELGKGLTCGFSHGRACP
jgi:hypothetical protein